MACVEGDKLGHVHLHVHLMEDTEDRTGNAMLATG